MKTQRRFQMNNEERIYCSYDHFNPEINRNTGEEIHACEHYGTIFCNKCECRYDGEKIHRYMDANPIEHGESK